MLHNSYIIECEIIILNIIFNLHQLYTTTIKVFHLCEHIVKELNHKSRMMFYEINNIAQS